MPIQNNGWTSCDGFVTSHSTSCLVLVLVLSSYKMFVWSKWMRFCCRNRSRCDRWNANVCAVRIYTHKCGVTHFHTSISLPQCEVRSATNGAMLFSQVFITYLLFWNLIPHNSLRPRHHLHSLCLSPAPTRAFLIRNFRKTIQLLAGSVLEYANVNIACGSLTLSDTDTHYSTLFVH